MKAEAKPRRVIIFRELLEQIRRRDAAGNKK